MVAYKKGTPGYYEQQAKYKQTLINKFGSPEALQEHYRKMGARGGKNGHTGGFAANPALARVAGAKGGHISSRASDKPSLQERRENYMGSL